MLSRLAALACLASAEAGDTVVAFVGKGSSGWQQYDWSSITHLAFWTMPEDDVKAKAKENGVKLFQSNKAHLGPSDWTSSSAVTDAVSAIKSQVSSEALDGVFFDYEGNSLSDAQKQAYTSYVKEVADAIAPAQVFVCVGGRPTYEWRNYDYAGLADVSAFLFIMGYDMHFWDDYTCVGKGTCSPAEAPLADLKAGVSEYTSLVASDKLVLGLPWYGQRYSQVLGVPFNEGQADLKDIWPLLYGDKQDRKKSHTLYDNDKDYAWKLMCNGACLDSGKGGVIWYDDETTLAVKYKVAGDSGLQGIGIWEVDKLDYTGEFDKYVRKMWDAVSAWKGTQLPALV
jgi:spore germination protein YaaH